MKKCNIVLCDCSEKEIESLIKALNDNTNYVFESKAIISNWQRKSKFAEITRYAKYVYAGLYAFMHRKNYNFIIGWQQFYTLLFCFLCTIFKVKKVNKVIVLNFTYKEKSGLIGKIYKKFMQKCICNEYLDFLHIPGEDAAQEIMKIFKITKEKFIICPFGINDIYNDFKTSKVDIKEKYILSIGRSNRDYDFLVDIWKEIGIQLIIISDTYVCKKRQNNVKIIDNISGKNQYPWIANAEAIILPIKEPKIASGDTVLLNSMSFKKIVLVTKPSVLEKTYIKNYENGIVIKKNKHEFIKVLNDICNTKKYEYIKKNAREDFLNHYSRYSFGKNIAKYIK